jgi:hypothetical protein
MVEWLGSEVAEQHDPDTISANFAVADIFQKSTAPLSRPSCSVRWREHVVTDLINSFGDGSGIFSSRDVTVARAYRHQRVPQSVSRSRK